MGWQGFHRGILGLGVYTGMLGTGFKACRGKVTVLKELEFRA